VGEVVGDDINPLYNWMVEIESPVMEDSPG
jgi:hypothetical protein